MLKTVRQEIHGPLVRVNALLVFMWLRLREFTPDQSIGRQAVVERFV